MKKRIVYVTYHYWPPDFGGELLLAIERFKGLVERGFEVTVLTSGHPDFPDRQMDDGLSVLRSPEIGQSRLARLARRFVYLLWACWQLFRHSFEVYYQGDTAGVDPLTSTMIVWVMTGIAHWKGAQCVTVHSLADSEQNTFDVHGWEGFCRRVQFRCFDALVAVGPGLYDALRAIFPQQSKLIINGVRDDIFRPLSEEERKCFRRQHNVREEQVVFAFLGTVGYRKGFDLIAEAFALLAPQYENWLLWVVGPLTQQDSQNLRTEEVMQVTRPLNELGTRVRYWGRIDDRYMLNSLLAASDIFIFPSRREGMPLAPMEAMGAGTPAIIARIPDVTDLANVEGQTGLYVPVGDSMALGSAMEKLATDAKLRQQFGRNAALRVKDSFGWRNHLDQWERLYMDPRINE